MKVTKQMEHRRNAKIALSEELAKVLPRYEEREVYRHTHDVALHLLIALDKAGLEFKPLRERRQ